MGAVVQTDTETDSFSVGIRCPCLVLRTAPWCVPGRGHVWCGPGLRKNYSYILCTDTHFPSRMVCSMVGVRTNSTKVWVHPTWISDSLKL